jgi:hypothetical protein
MILMVMMTTIMTLKMMFNDDDPLDDHDTHVGDGLGDPGDGDDHLSMCAHGHIDFIVRTKLQQVRAEWRQGGVDEVLLARCSMDASRERVLHSMAHTHEDPPSGSSRLGRSGMRSTLSARIWLRATLRRFEK